MWHTGLGSRQARSSQLSLARGTLCGSVRCTLRAELNLRLSLEMIATLRTENSFTLHPAKLKCPYVLGILAAAAARQRARQNRDKKEILKLTWLLALHHCSVVGCLLARVPKPIKNAVEGDCEAEASC